MKVRLCGKMLTLDSFSLTNLAVELRDSVPFSLVKVHSGPHAMIATVVTTCPTWDTGTSGKEPKAGTDTGQRVNLSSPYKIVQNIMNL